MPQDTHVAIQPQHHTHIHLRHYEGISTDAHPACSTRSCQAVRNLNEVVGDLTGELVECKSILNRTEADRSTLISEKASLAERVAHLIAASAANTPASGGGGGGASSSAARSKPPIPLSWDHERVKTSTPSTSALRGAMSSQHGASSAHTVQASRREAFLRDVSGTWPSGNHSDGEPVEEQALEEHATP